MSSSSMIFEFISAFTMTNLNYVSATVDMFWRERIKFYRLAGATA